MDSLLRLWLIKNGRMGGSGRGVYKQIEIQRRLLADVGGIPCINKTMIYKRILESGNLFICVKRQLRSSSASLFNNAPLTGVYRKIFNCFGTNSLTSSINRRGIKGGAGMIVKNVFI